MQSKSLFTILIFSSSLYLGSLSIIENVETVWLSSLVAIDTKAEESIPPLKQNAKGTSDLNLYFTLFVK